jgi:hypothetical protein
VGRVGEASGMCGLGNRPSVGHLSQRVTQSQPEQISPRWNAHRGCEQMREPAWGERDRRCGRRQRHPPFRRQGLDLQHACHPPVDRRARTWREDPYHLVRERCGSLRAEALTPSLEESRNDRCELRSFNGRDATTPLPYELWDIHGVSIEPEGRDHGHRHITLVGLIRRDHRPGVVPPSGGRARAQPYGA